MSSGGGCSPDNGLNTVALALKWYPTTGESGYRAGLGDYDPHEKVATRLGGHYTRSDETRQGQPNTDGFDNVQIRLSDGSVIFKPGLFGPGIVIDEATYQMYSFDAGVKHRGFSLEGEYYRRRVDQLKGPGVGALPVDEFNDEGFQAQASSFTAGIAGSTGGVYGQRLLAASTSTMYFPASGASLRGSGAPRLTHASKSAIVPAERLDTDCLGPRGALRTARVERSSHVEVAHTQGRWLR